MDEPEQDAEQARWQESIYSLLKNMVRNLPKEHRPVIIDGSGCESGDPLDVTLSEIQQAFNAFIDYIDDNEGICTVCSCRCCDKED